MADLSYLPDDMPEEEEKSIFESASDVVDSVTGFFEPRAQAKPVLSYIPDVDSGVNNAKQNFSLNAGVNPEAAARQYALSKKTGIPMSLVRERPEVVEEAAITPDFLRMSISHPKSVDYYKNFESAEISKDDWPALNNLERVFKNVKTSFQVGKQNVEGGKLYTGKVLNNITGTESPELDKQISEFEARQIRSPVDENFLETGITGASEMLPLIFESVAGGVNVGLQTATSFATGALLLGQAGPQAATPEEIVTVPAAAATGYFVGSRAGAANAMFLVETGLAYQEMKDTTDENGQKLDPIIASVASVGVGSINAGLEFVGLNALAKLIPGGQKVLGGIITEPVKQALKKESVRTALAAVGKKYAGVVGTETLTEMAQEVVNILGTEIAKDIAEVTDNTFFKEIKLEEAVPRIAEAGREALAATMVLGIPGATLSASKRVIEARNTNDFVEQQTEINQAVNETKTKERSPEKMKEFFDINGIKEDAFIGAETVQELFQNDEVAATALFEKLGVDVKQSQEAAEVGQDTKIDAATMQSNLSEEEFNILIPDLKPAPSTVSQRELESINLVEEIQNTADLYAEAIGEQVVFQEELSRVRKEAIEAGENVEVVDSNLKLMEDFANRMSLEGRDRTAIVKRIRIRKGTIEEAQAKKKIIEKVKEFLQPKENVPRGSVRITKDEDIVTLFKDRNFSTLLHETGHVYFNEFQQVANLPDSSAQIKEDFGILRDWAGLEEGQNFGVKEQEQFARGFETWLLEGKAPTQELIPVFTRFKNWLLSVYQSAVSLNAPITDEVRGVLDRMFTAKTQIVAEAQSNEMMLWPKEQLDALGVVSDDRDFMKRLLNQSYEKAELAMVKDRNKSARSLSETWKNLAEKEFEEAPNYKQAKLMREGDGINTEEIRDAYGDDLADIMSKKRIAKVDGVSIDESVQLSDFETPEAMFRGLLETKSKPEFTKDFVNAQRAAHDKLFRAIDYLSTTEEYSQFLEIKSKYLNRSDGKPTNAKPRQIFKQFAKEWLDQRPVRDAVRVDRFMSAQAKYSRQESEALRQNNLGKAAKANELVRQNYELARESLKNREEIGKLERLAKRITKRDPAKIEDKYREPLYDVMLRFGLTNPNKIKVDGPVDLPNLLSGDEDIDPFFASQTLLYAKDKSYKDIQMAEARDLRNLLNYLSIHGRTPEEQVLSSGEKALPVSTAMAAESEGSSKTIVFQQDTLRAKLTGFTRAFYSSFNSFNFVMVSMGNYVSIGKGGTFSLTEERTSQAIVEAENQNHKLKLELNKKLWPSYKQLFGTINKLKKQHGDKITQNVPETPTIIKNNGQTNWWRPEQILALALNVGNKSNRERIFTGFQGFTETDLSRLLDFVSIEDMDAIQNIWNLNDEIFEEVKKVNFRINHTKLEKIPAQEFIFKGKQYRGGYSPVRYDRKMAENAGGVKESRIANLGEKADLMSRQESRFQSPAPKSGFVKGRVGMTPYPLLLSMEPLGDHITDTARYITHAEVIRDVNMLIGADPFRDAVREHLGMEVYNDLKPELQFIANPRKLSQDPQLDGLFGRLRQMATTWTLAYNHNVAAKQFFSAPAAALKIGKRAWLGAYMKTVFDVPNIKNKYDFMLKNSPFMDARTNSFDQEFKKQFSSLSSKQRGVLFGDKLITWEDVVAVGFLPIKIVDMATVLPLWTTAYNQKMKDIGAGLPKDHDLAVKFADEVIRTTQPSAQALDLTKVQRSTGLWQLFSMFGTFTIGKYQQRVRLNWRAFKSNKISTPKYLETVFLEQLLPAVGMATVMQLIKGSDFDDDDTIETIAADAAQSLITLPIPVLGSMLYPFSSYAFSLSPVENIAVAVQRPTQKLGKELLKGKRADPEEAAKAAMWTVANLISIWKRVPVSKVVQKIDRSLEN